MLQPDQVTDSLHAYQLAKRANSLRVMSEAVRWGRRGARVNTISPGIIFTPLARDELTGPRGAGYRRMLELSPVGRGGTPDEVATVAALLLGPTAHSSPAATFSWTAASPPPGSTATSPRNDRSPGSLCHRCGCQAVSCSVHGKQQQLRLVLYPAWSTHKEFWTEGPPGNGPSSRRSLHGSAGG
jgi:hypothetical protein